eukprot:343365_1
MKPFKKSNINNIYTIQQPAYNYTTPSETTTCLYLNNKNKLIRTRTISTFQLTKKQPKSSPFNYTKLVTIGCIALAFWILIAQIKEISNRVRNMEEVFIYDIYDQLNEKINNGIWGMKHELSIEMNGVYDEMDRIQQFIMDYDAIQTELNHKIYQHQIILDEIIYNRTHFLNCILYNKKVHKK